MLPVHVTKWINLHFRRFDTVPSKKKKRPTAQAPGPEDLILEELRRTFIMSSCFGIRSTSVLAQEDVRDSGHSAESEVGNQSDDTLCSPFFSLKCFLTPKVSDNSVSRSLRTTECALL